MDAAPRPRTTEFRILGPLEVSVDGEERHVSGDKLRALLVALLLHANRPVSTERLIDDLWGEDAPAAASASVHAHVARLRRVLANSGEGSVLESDRRGYFLRIEDDQLDASRFRTLLAAAREARRAGRLDAARERYAEALALWRGPALDGVPLERADSERLELEGLRAAALEERIDVDLELGGAAELVPELERLVGSEPYRERAWAQLMLALYASGRQADALAAYRQARRALGELGLEPGPTLRELEHSILQHDPSLVTASLPPARRMSVRANGRLVAIALGLVAAAMVAAVAVATRAEPPEAARSSSARAVGDSLVELDPRTGRVLSVTRVGRGPASIATTIDAIWVANTEDRTVARVDRRTKAVRTVGGAPVAYHLVSALNGDVWLSSFEEPYVTLIAERGRLGVDVESSVGPARRIELPGSAEGLAAGGGYLWVTSPASGGRDKVFLVDLRTHRLVSSVEVGKLPLAVTFGYGSAWIANYRGDSVSVIRPGSAQPETVAVPGGPLGIAAGEGAIWVVAFWTSHLVRIDPETRRVVRRIPIGAGPLGVAVGGGAIWVTNRDDNTVMRVDPATNRVTQTIELASSPWAIRFGHGRVWVTTQRCGSPIEHCAGD